jgi:hypothetical protein
MVVKIPYNVGDVVNVKFLYSGGEFNGKARIVDEIYGIEWDEKRRKWLKGRDLVKVQTPAFELLDESEHLQKGHRICGTWGDIVGVCEEVGQ